MQTILVTGGAGFIGSNFVRHALARTRRAGRRARQAHLRRQPREPGRRRTATRATRSCRATSPTARRCARCSASTARRRRELRGRDPRRPLDRRSRRASSARTSLGTFELLEAARQPPARARRGRGASASSTSRPTRSTARSARPGLFSETTPYAPNSPYAASKAAADHLVRAYHETYRLPALITNCSNNYGPYQFPEKLIPLMILNALEGQPLPIYGDGGNVRDWLYVEDHCEGILLVLQQGRAGREVQRRRRQRAHEPPGGRRALRGARGRAAGARRTRRSRAQGLGSYAGAQDLRRRPARPRPALRDRRHEDPRASSAGRRATTSRAACAQTVRWYLGNRAWCEAVQSGKYRRERLGRCG